MTVEIVELALPDGLLLPSELKDPYITKIGGRPTWPVSAEELKKLGVDPARLVCKSCNSPLFLVLQMDAPWSGEESFFDRIMYVFGCNSRVCTETTGTKAWEAFVIQVPSKKAAEKKAEEASKPTASLWDAVMLGAKEAEKEIVPRMEDLSLQEETAFYDKQFPVGFPPIRLHICEEMIYERETNRNEEQMEVFTATPFGEEAESWMGETYESSPHPPGVDKALLAFQKRVSSYPRQCVRFSPAGKPLPFHEEPDGLPSPGTCEKCGQQRVFELQVMPAILSLLPCGDEQYVKHLPESLRGQHAIFGDGMEWGTLMVFTCGTCTRSSSDAQLIRAVTHTQIEQL